MSHRALVVDDDKSLQLLFLTLLTKRGFIVDCVPDGGRARENLERNDYCVVLLDLMMPRVSGFELLDEIRARKPGLLPRVVISTGVAERVLARLDCSGVRTVLPKPFDIDELAVAASRCCEEYHRH